jgi:hypothetical protein
MNDKMIIAHLRGQLFDAKAKIAELKANANIGHTFGPSVCGEEISIDELSITLPRDSIAPPTSDVVFTKNDKDDPLAREAGQLGGGGSFEDGDFEEDYGFYDIRDVLVKDANIKYQRVLDAAWAHYCEVQKSLVTVYNDVCSYCDKEKKDG